LLAPPSTTPRFVSPSSTPKKINHLQDDRGHVRSHSGLARDFYDSGMMLLAGGLMAIFAMLAFAGML